MTGVLPVTLNGSTTRITSRHTSDAGNEKAFEYLKNRLLEYGYTPVTDPFSANGKNIYAIKTGTRYPDRAYLICAHYDAIAVPFNRAQGADDNASGCAAVMEAARLLQDTDVAYTVIFAFWDEEEQGLIGSDAFVQQFDFDQIKMEAVINIDMIGYDHNNDMRTEIHTRPFRYSEELAMRMQQYNTDYQIGLDVEIRNPGTTASDHASFWNAGISSILLIEDAQDFNAYYHTYLDSVGFFNDTFFYRNTQLAIATLLHLSSDTSFRLAVEKNALYPLRCYPNPADEYLVIQDMYAGPFRFELYDITGKLRYSREGTKVSTEERIDLQYINAGTYYYKYLVSENIHTGKIVISGH